MADARSMSCVNRTTFGGPARPRVPTKKWRDSAGRDKPLARPGVRGERDGRRTTHELCEPDDIRRTREPRVPTKKWRGSAGRDDPLARPRVRAGRVMVREARLKPGCALMSSNGEPQDIRTRVNDICGRGYGYSRGATERAEEAKEPGVFGSDHSLSGLFYYCEPCHMGPDSGSACRKRKRGSSSGLRIARSLPRKFSRRSAKGWGRTSVAGS
jgi:hypothetical protein